MTGDIGERLERLEFLLMSQEESLERLGELLRDQQRQISKQTGELELLREKLSKYETGGEPEDLHQPPPHY
jgi:uncharacterized coiled-coil protein SlyX